MNWGWKIVALYSGFAIWIFGLAFACFQQDFFLVTEDYYQQELLYQQRIDAIKLTQQLSQQPEVRRDASTDCLHLTMPDGHSKAVGTLRLYHPVNPAFDKEFALPLPDCVSLTHIQGGRWEAQLAWELANKSYYHAEHLQL